MCACVRVCLCVPVRACVTCEVVCVYARVRMKARAPYRASHARAYVRELASTYRRVLWCVRPCASRLVLVEWACERLCLCAHVRAHACACASLYVCRWVRACMRACACARVRAHARALVCAFFDLLALLSPW